MTKTGVKQTASGKGVKHILISQPRPESDKSPYFELEKKYPVNLVFHPFIKFKSVQISVKIMCQNQ